MLIPNINKVMLHKVIPYKQSQNMNFRWKSLLSIFSWSTANSSRNTDSLNFLSSHPLLLSSFANNWCEKSRALFFQTLINRTELVIHFKLTLWQQEFPTGIITSFKLQPKSPSGIKFQTLLVSHQEEDESIIIKNSANRDNHLRSSTIPYLYLTEMGVHHSSSKWP